jgi:ribose transport system substrate-binding protein
MRNVNSTFTKAPSGACSRAGRGGRLATSATSRPSRGLFAAVVLVLGLAACSSATADNGPTSGSSVSLGSSQTKVVADATALIAKYRDPSNKFVAPGPSLDAKSLRGGSLYYVSLSQAIPVLAIEQNGLKQAADALGMTFHVCDGKFQPAQAAACINEAVSAGAKGIFTDSIVTQAVSTAVANAAGHGVPIVAVSSIGTDSKGITFRTNGDERSEAIAADWIVADSGGKARVLMTSVQDDSGALNDIATGSKPELAKCTGCTTETASYTSGTIPGIPSLISSSLLKNRDITYGLPQFDFLVPLFKSGVQTAGYTTKMKIVSTNAVLSSMQLVKSGGQAADAASNRNYSGWEAADAMVRMIKGLPAPTESNIPIRLFDKANIGAISLTTAAAGTGEWFGPLDYQKSFQQLWGL